MEYTLVTKLSDLILGTTKRMRLMVAQTGLVLFLAIAFAVVQHGEVLAGLVDRDASNRLSVINISGVLFFYVVLRSGLSGRISADPSLSLVQMIYGVFVTAASYSITGPARGAVLTLMVFIVVFGMFTLTVRQSRRLAWFALVVIGCVMIWKSSTQPLRYPLAVEAVHFMFAALVLGGVSSLSISMGKLRSRLQDQKCKLAEQKASLEHALEQIRLLATQDELTGLCNRRHMRTLLAADENVRRAMALVLIDIDFFKRVNDVHGHMVGDKVLKRFAEISRAVLRDGDVLSRWGGEEFLLMLPNTDSVAALQFVDRLRLVLAQSRFDDIAPQLQVTFSAGVSLCVDSTRLDSAIERADVAMYRAKTLGRDRSVFDTAGGGQTDMVIHLEAV